MSYLTFNMPLIYILSLPNSVWTYNPEPPLILELWTTLKRVTLQNV